MSDRNRHAVVRDDQEWIPFAEVAAAEVKSDVSQVFRREGFDAGRRRGYREAQALVSLVVEELIVDHGLGDAPPSLLRSIAAALTARLDRYTPNEVYVEGGLGI